MRRKVYVFSLFSMAWMILIFYYSHKPIYESRQDSYKLGLVTGSVAIEDFNEKSFYDQLAFAMKVDHPVRKLAHFTEYFILAVFLFGAVDRRGRKFYLRWLIPWAIAFVYAVTDEMHQFFVPGRNCNALDVLIDSAGACVGALVCLGVVHLFSRKKVSL